MAHGNGKHKDASPASYRQPFTYTKNRLQPLAMRDPFKSRAALGPEQSLRIHGKTHGIEKTETLFRLQFPGLFIGGKGLSQFLQITVRSGPYLFE